MGGLVGEQVDVLGHEDVGRDEEALLLAGLFEESDCCVFCFGRAEEGLALVTAEGYEVEVVGLLKALEAGWHSWGEVYIWESEERGCERFTSHPSQRREGWGTRAFGVGMRFQVGQAGCGVAEECGITFYRK